uniref:Putative secreted peptide n=1 Tax=Anopheles braziliensis TaxID=58242 RepID=A0A2M3ZNF9_9DIPT
MQGNNARCLRNVLFLLRYVVCFIFGLLSCYAVRTPVPRFVRRIDRSTVHGFVNLRRKEIRAGILFPCSPPNPKP